MSTLTFISPRSILVRIADIFQKPEGIAADSPKETRGESTEKKENLRGEALASPKSKLNISMDDLKIISTALLHYKRNLAKLGEMKRAEGVGQIDQKFYNLILQLEDANCAEENIEETSAA